MINAASFTNVSIGNMALSLIGARSTITDLNENSAEAQQIRLWYNFSLLETLQQFNWGFAKQRVSLVAYTDSPSDTTGYEYRYHDLTDSVVVRSIWNPNGTEDDAIPFEMETFGGEKTLLTNMEDAIAIYTYYETDTSLYPAGFVEALSACIAYHIAFPLTGSREVQSTMFNAFNMLSRKGAGNDANEGQATKPRGSEAERARA